MLAPTTLATVSVALIAFSTACLPSSVVADRAEGRFERTLAVTAPVELDVSSGSGRIEVRTGTSDRIDVRAHVVAHDGWSLGGSRVSAAERVARIETDPPIEQSGASVRIGHIADSAIRNVSISYTLTVPAETTVVLSTGSGSQLIDGVRGAVQARAGSGSVEVRDAGATVNLSTGSGSIEIDRVAGAVAASAGSGSIRATGVGGGARLRTASGDITMDQDGAGDVDASAASGSIHLSGIRGGLRASTASGSISVHGEQTSRWTLDAASGSVSIELGGTPAFNLDAHSGSGGIDSAFAVAGTRGRRDLRGTVNGGGPVLHVRTASGRIQIR